MATSVGSAHTRSPANLIYLVSLPKEDMLKHTQADLTSGRLRHNRSCSGQRSQHPQGGLAGTAAEVVASVSLSGVPLGELAVPTCDDSAGLMSIAFEAPV